MIDYDEIVAEYKRLVGEKGIESAEAYLSDQFQDTTLPEEISKEVEVFLMTRETDSNEDSTVDVVADSSNEVRADTVQEESPVTESTEEGQMSQEETTQS